MDEWIEILVAFVKDDKNYVFGTKSAAEMKVATSDAAIEIEFDEKFEKLATLGDVFAGKA